MNLKKVIKKREIFNVTLIIFITLIFASIVLTLSFVSGPNITGAPDLFTINDLTCTWTGSADTTSYTVTWFKNGVNETALYNLTTILASNTTKNENWTCEVTLHNATVSLAQNATVTIKNTAPDYPILFYLNVERSNYYNIYEDESYNFVFNSTDADGDSLIYSIGDLSSRNMCTIENIYTGQLSCNPTHYTITGTNDSALEQPLNYTVRLRAEESSGQGFSSHTDFIFTIIPVNEQAEFVETEEDLEDISAEATLHWSMIINGIDEELDYPLNFTLSSDLNDAFPGLLIINSYSSTSANISFNTVGSRPSNEHVGLWNVTLFVTDNASSNATRPPTNISFELEIFFFNSPPNITNLHELNDSSWTQGDEFLFDVKAEDLDDIDNITFFVQSPTDNAYKCNLTTFPWNITTTDSSHDNATGRIHIPMLTNDHVICRYVEIIAMDNTSASTKKIAFINITNVNDPPEIHEISINGNISDQTARLLVPFIYQVNATDPDQYTYDYNVTGILTYSTNNSNFVIHPNTGLINVTPNTPSLVGIHSILVTVNDSEYTDSRVLIVEVINNSAPILNVDSEPIAFNQNDAIRRYFDGIEPDGHVMSYEIQSLTAFNSSIYNDFTYVVSDLAGTPRLTNWGVNLTNANPRLANDLVGYHSFNITLKDAYNAFDGNSSKVISFTIYNQNDAPYFDMDQNNVSDNITFGNGTVVANRAFSLIIKATDYDLFLQSPWADESLTFNYSNASASLSNINFQKISGTNNQALLQFTPTQQGNHNITLRVTDFNGTYDEQIIHFTVYQNTSDPVFTELRPYRNATSNQTFFTFNTTNLNLVSNAMDIYVEENTSVTFDANIRFDPFIESIEGPAVNTLNIKWYVNGVLKSNINNANPKVNSAYDHYFDFFSSGLNNVTAVVTDLAGSTSNFTWRVYTANVNRNPVYCPGTLENITVSGLHTIPKYFSFRNSKQRFYDPDENPADTGPGTLNPCSFTTEPLNYGLNSSKLEYEVIVVSSYCPASFTTLEHSISIRPTARGECRLRFQVTDLQGASALSDIIILDILDFVRDGAQDSGERIVTVTQTITIPYQEDVDVPKPISIINPGNAIIYVNKTIEIPLIIKNTWTAEIRDISLSGIALNATMMGEDNLTVSFSRDRIGSLSIGEQADVTLILTNYRSEGPYFITVYANVAEPEFTDSENIFIASLEQTPEGQDIQSKVTYARDLLMDNPECLELNDLLLQANLLLEAGNYLEALRVLEAAINGCKYLTNQRERVRTESPSFVKNAFNFSLEHATEMIIGSVLLLILTIVFYVIVAIKHKMPNS